MKNRLQKLNAAVDKVEEKREKHAVNRAILELLNEKVKKPEIKEILNGNRIRLDINGWVVYA